MFHPWYGLGFYNFSYLTFFYSQLLHTGFQTMFAEWSNSGELLAVAGRVSLTHSETDVNYHHLNRIKFFSDSGNPVYTVLIPFYKVSDRAFFMRS